MILTASTWPRTIHSAVNAIKVDLNDLNTKFSFKKKIRKKLKI